MNVLLLIYYIFSLIIIIWKMGNMSECDGTQMQSGSDPIRQLSSDLQVYANRHNLMRYDAEVRKYVQTLFIFGQSHLADKLISLITNNNVHDQNLFMKDLAKINFQEFDEICHKSPLYSKDIHANPAISRREVEILGAKTIKDGQKCLKLHNFLFILPFKCFGSTEDLFYQTDLLSKNSKLQIFKQKLQALRLRYNCKLQVYIICPQAIFKSIKQLLSRDKTFTVLLYEPSLPCFTGNNKIITEGNRIKFNYHEGDLFNFLLTHPQFKQTLEKYDYLIFPDISNLVSPAINPAYLGLLNSDQNINVLASVKLPHSITALPIRNSFIQVDDNSLGDILIKSSFLRSVTERSQHSYSVINEKIEKKKLNGANDCYFLSRLPQDILHSSFTQVVKVPYIANNAIQLSNFCKQTLGIDNENQNDIVEISPMILHGFSEHLEPIRETLKERSEQLCYPIIITKNREIEN